MGQLTKPNLIYILRGPEAQSDDLRALLKSRTAAIGINPADNTEQYVVSACEHAYWPLPTLQHNATTHTSALEASPIQIICKGTQQEADITFNLQEWKMQYWAKSNWRESDWIRLVTRKPHSSNLADEQIDIIGAQITAGAYPDQVIRTA